MEIILEDILELVKKKMREQGGFTREVYREFVHETINYFIEKGKINEDDNLKFIEDRLLDMWEEVKDSLAS